MLWFKKNKLEKVVYNTVHKIKGKTFSALIYLFLYTEYERALLWRIRCSACPLNVRNTFTCPGRWWVFKAVHTEAFWETEFENRRPPPGRPSPPFALRPGDWPVARPSSCSWLLPPSVGVVFLLLPGETGQPGAQEHGHNRPGSSAEIRPANLAAACRPETHTESILTQETHTESILTQETHTQSILTQETHTQSILTQETHTQSILTQETHTHRAF